MSDVPPNDVIAEETFLGAVLDNPARFYEHNPSTEHFYDPQCQALWIAIRDSMADVGATPGSAELVSKVRAELHRTGAIKTLRVSFDVFVTSILERVLSGADLGIHWSRIDTLRRQREARRAAVEMFRAVSAPHANVQQVLDEHAGRIASIAAGDSVRAVTLPELLDRSMERAEAIRSGRATPRLACGVNVVDELFGGGLGPGHYSIIAAKPKMGKSRLTLRMALEMVRSRRWAVDYYSLELGQDDVEDLVNTALTATPRGELLKKSVFDDERFHERWKTLRGVKGDLRAYFHEPGAELTIDVIRRNTVARTQQSELPVAVFVDYLQLVPDPKTPKEYERVTNSTKALATLAHTYSCVVIATAQFNREGAKEGRKTGMPKPDQLRSSGQIEQDVDELVILHRHAVEISGSSTHEKREGEIWMALNRHGETPMLKVDCDMATLRFDFRGRP